MNQPVTAYIQFLQNNADELFRVELTDQDIMALGETIHGRLFSANDFAVETGPPNIRRIVLTNDFGEIFDGPFYKVLSNAPLEIQIEWWHRVRAYHEYIYSKA